MRRRNNIAVELTPLLDVILIILFLIISGERSETERVKEEAEAAAAAYRTQEEQLQAQLSDTEKELFDARNSTNGYLDFEENSLIISIGIMRDRSGERRITVSDKNETSHISYNWENLRYGENSLKAELKKRISKNDEKPVFISFGYDEDDIYLRDHTLITDVLTGLEGDDIYISYNDLRKDN